jgi:thiol-disulfide isomerase/thioredoxin
MIQTDKQEILCAELAKHQRVLVLFFASWCPFCMRFVPVFDKEAQTLGVDDVVHVQLDDYDSPLWDSYNVAAVPTIILFEDGKISSRLDAQLGVGLSMKQFQTWVTQQRGS